jgi:Putative zinc-finger
MERETLKAALAPGPGCLSTEQLGRYADGALAAADRAAAAGHIRACVNCQAELGLLREFTSTGVRPGEAAIVRDGVARLKERSGSPLAFFRLAAVAAMVLLIAVTGLYFLAGRVPTLPASVSTDNEITRSQAVSLRAPIGEQQDPPRRFEWAPVARASRYRLRLLEVDRRELWSASTSAVGIEVPSETRTLIVPAKTLLWEVTAYDSAGAVIAESGLQAFVATRR